MSATTSHTPTVAILTALDSALVSIRKQNPDVPTALAVTLASGKGKTHGHFAKGAWVDVEGESKGSGRHEINMATESLSRGAEATLTTLIHESAHALAHATNVADTTRQGRYHNAKFEKLASAMGCLTAKDDKIGWRTVGLTDWAKTHYAKDIAKLADSLVTYRKPVGDKPKAPRTTVRVACECDIPVTVPIKVYVDFIANNLVCELCGQHLLPVD